MAKTKKTPKSSKSPKKPAPKKAAARAVKAKYAAAKKAPPPAKKKPAPTKAKALAPKKKKKKALAPKKKAPASTKTKAPGTKKKSKNAPAPKVKVEAKPAVKKGASRKPAAPAKRDEATPTLTWSTREELAAAWNEAGRAYFTRYSDLLTRLYAGENVEVDGTDPRSEADGEAVLKEIIAMNAAGEGDRVRDLFDPAYAPVFSWIKDGEDSLRFITLLGEDDVLVVHGSPWKTTSIAYHLRGTTVRVLPGIIGVARSRDRSHLVLAREDGLSVYDANDGVEGLFREPVATHPWPSFDILRPEGMNEEQATEWEGERAEQEEDTRWDVESLAISDDGTRVVMTAYRQGILLASSRAGDVPGWKLLYPRAGEPWNGGTHSGDMTHVAISPDGNRLAFGSQDTAHYTATLDETGVPQWYATVGPLSEYPHFAAFSDDGRYTAFNSCHFYNGATICFDWEGNEGKRLEGYQVNPESPCIEDGLRVYAGTYLPAEVASAIVNEPVDGAFALAGSGLLRIVDLHGKLLSVQGFGSSAGSIDYDPITKRLALGSYSGMLHIYAADEEEERGRIDGVRSRKEVARWALWPQLPHGPIRW